MGIAQDLHNNITAERGASPVVTSDNTAVVSEIIDMRGKKGLEFVIMAGVLADAAATFVPLIEHGDDSGLSDAAAVPDADLLGVETTFDQADDNGVWQLGYKGTKRYVRLTVTPADNAASAPLAILAIGKPTVRGST